MKKVLLAMTAVAALSLTSCNDNDQEEPLGVVNYYFEFPAADYNEQGYWSDVYNTGVANLAIYPNIQLTHSASADTYDGVEYKSWKGFCPSSSTDNSDWTNREDWVAHQWGNITGRAAGDKDKGYMIACWDVAESTDKVPDKVSVGFGTLFANSQMHPLQVYVTNTTWGYYAMKNGTAFNRAFTSSDWCKVVFTGLNGYTKTGEVEVYLARNGQILDKWELVDLTPLGKCQAVYAQMFSSDSGEWGMNNPAYFAMDELMVDYQ